MLIINTHPSAGFILPCTNKLLSNFKNDLLFCLKQDKKNILGIKEEELLNKANKLLKMPIFKPDCFKSAVVKMGKGVEVVIDGRPPIWVMIDGVLVLKQELFGKELIAQGTPLGMALMNKAKKAVGRFKVDGKFHNFEILNIIPYQEAKMLFFPKISLAA